VGSVRVRAYVFPEHLEAGFAALEAISKSVELFSSIYGTYERPSLSLVESTFSDGIEFDGLFYLGQEYFAVYKSGARNYLTALSAHETAHQWWYAMTSSDQALEPWLDEALCTFSERLFYESVHPEDVEWWLQTRIQTYTPQGAVNSSIYDFSAFRPYVNAVYLRGAEFLGDLRDKMGSSAFEAFLQDYFSTLNSKSEKDQLGLATAETFWQVIANHYEGDLKDLRSEYFK
jgi:aminopeptidase N